MKKAAYGVAIAALKRGVSEIAARTKDGLDQRTCDGCGHECGDGAGDHRFDAEFCDIMTSIGRHTADAADLDGDGAEICEAAEGVGGDDDGAIAEHIDNAREMKVGDELVDGGFFADELGDEEAFVERNAHKKCDGEEEPTEDDFEGKERPDAFLFEGRGVILSGSGSYDGLIEGFGGVDSLGLFAGDGFE